MHALSLVNVATIASICWLSSPGCFDCALFSIGSTNNLYRRGRLRNSRALTYFVQRDRREGRSPNRFPFFESSLRWELHDHLRSIFPIDTDSAADLFGKDGN